YRLAVTMLGFLALAGCGKDSNQPELATVNGAVTLDGQLLSKAKITFQPKGAGAPSYGTADAEGKFILYYGNTGKKGAVLGEHLVRINAVGDGDDTTDRLPANYNLHSTLTTQVEKGDNQPKFELVSKPAA